jgi:heptosyltransferase I
MMLTLGDTPHICILRLSALGDATHVVPVVHAIRDHRPDARITWIIGKWEHRLLQDLPGAGTAPLAA